MITNEYWVTEVFEDDNYDNMSANRLLRMIVFPSIEEAVAEAEATIRENTIGTWITISTEFQDLGVQLEWGRDAYGNWQVLSDPNNTLERIAEEVEEMYVDDCA